MTFNIITWWSSRPLSLLAIVLHVVVASVVNVDFFANAAAVGAEDRDTQPPNIIMILAEDMGWGDLASYGHPYARTPNIDKLASEGTKFERFYVTGTTCNPSRTGLMTGRNPAEFPSYPADFGIPEGVPTVTRLLKDEAGYRTGHVGKWHLGPEDMGQSYGIEYVKVIGPSHKDPNGRDSAVFGAALDFIEDSSYDTRPFYINIWSHIAHSPVKPPQNLVDLFADVKVDRSLFDVHMQRKFDEVEELGGSIDEGMRNYLADLYALDLQIGLVMDKLDELGIAENTLVAVSADHGAAPVLAKEQSHPTNMLGYAGGLRGGKHDFYEGGLREPFIIRWPGHVPAGATNNDSVIWAMDWLPTLASIAGINVDATLLDGEDVTDILTGESNRSRAGPLLWKVPHFNINSKMVIMYDNYKLHMWKATKTRKERMELYNLMDDPEEEFDLHGQYPEVANELSASLFSWEDQLPPKYAKGNDDPLPFNSEAKPHVAQPLIVPGLKVLPKASALPTLSPTAEPTREKTSNDWMDFLFLNGNGD